MVEILFNDEIKEYTLKEKIKNSKSYKKVPIKYKEIDSTAKFRKEILKKKILENNN